MPSGIAHYDSGEAALALARSVGIVLDDWQQFCVLTGCAERADGTWAAFECYIDVPRQNGKGEVLLVRQLAGLFLHKEPLQLHSAHEFKTAKEHFLRVRNVIDANPSLSKLIKHVYTGAGAESIVTHDGCRLLFVARSRSSSRGFTGTTLYLDEAFKLPREALGAMVPTMSAVRNPQIWYTSSAPHADSETLHDLQDRLVLATSKRFFGASWSNEVGTDPADRAAWQSANPALGTRLSIEFTENELETLPRAEFARERLGIAEARDGTASSVLPSADWLACADVASQIVGQVSIALDVTPEGSFASFGAAGDRSDGLTHVEVIDRRPGTGWVVARAGELARRWGCSIVIDPRSPAGGLLAQLQAARVPVAEVTGSELAQSCAAFQQKVLTRTLRHISDPQLDAAIAGASVRTIGEAWAWSRVSSAIDISPLVAVTLAAGTRVKRAAPVFAY